MIYEVTLFTRNGSKHAFKTEEDLVTLASRKQVMYTDSIGRRVLIKSDAVDYISLSKTYKDEPKELDDEEFPILLDEGPEPDVGAF